MNAETGVRPELGDLPPSVKSLGVVRMVSLVVTGFVPGVTIVGLKVKDVSVGSPVRLKLMGLVNALFCGATVRT
jgi:hypothetical protein